MRAWWSLYKKEFANNLFIMSVIILLTLAWQIFLFFRIDIYGLSFGLSFLPIAFYPLIVLYMGYNGFKQEWKDDTNYFILSLPRYGWQISLAKLASVMSFFIVVSVVSLFLTYILQYRFINPEILIPEISQIRDILIKSVIQLFIGYLFIGLGIYILAQFSQIISLFYNRLRGLITVIVFILSHYLIFRGATLLAPLLGWLPDIPIETFNYNNGLLNTFVIYIGSGPFVGLLIMLIALFLLASWILESQLEV
ncbi:hypothetical protein [Natronospora cellulosivora (SeqCode)]